MTDFKRRDRVRVIKGDPSDRDNAIDEMGTVVGDPIPDIEYMNPVVRVLLDGHDHGGALFFSPDELELIEAAGVPKVGEQITTLAELESLPLGTTLMVDGIGAYQRIIDGDWYIAGSDIGTDSAELIRSKSLLVIWLPEADQ